MPLDDVCERLLLKHKKFTRFHLDEYYGSMSRIPVSNRLADVGELDETEALSSMRQKLKNMERTRHPAVWHDHTSVANHGYLLFLVGVSYDPAIHLTDKE